jgi:hypothetical protein
MNKFLIATLIAAATSASAADVSVSAVRDYNLDKTGVRLETTLLGVSLSATNVSGEYNRLAVGKTYDLLSVGPVSLGVSGAGVYHARLNPGEDGYGATIGARVSYKLDSNASVIAGVEQFYGQRRLRDTSGVSGNIGLKVTF